MKPSKFADFVRAESGATAIEYALIAGILSIGIVAALTQISGPLSGVFTSVASRLTAGGV